MTDRIGVSFTITTEDDKKISALGIPHYTDTLWFDSMDAFSAMSSDEIEAMKQERYDNWRAQVLNPPPTSAQVAPSADEALMAAQQALSDAQVAVQAAIDAPRLEAQAMIDAAQAKVDAENGK